MGAVGFRSLLPLPRGEESGHPPGFFGRLNFGSPVSSSHLPRAPAEGSLGPSRMAGEERANGGGMNASGWQRLMEEDDLALGSRVRVFCKRHLGDNVKTRGCTDPAVSSDAALFL